MSLIFVGAGSLAEKIYRKLRLVDSNFELKVILDNSEEKKGKPFMNTFIDSVENIDLYYKQGDKVVITSSFYKEIISQLEFLGVFEIVTYLDFESAVNKKLLRKNSILKDCKKLSRVFIVGNGPSLNKMNLSYLQNEDTIMVNHIYKSEKLLNLCPNFWVVADPGFWNDEMGFVRIIKQTLTDQLPNTKFLINIEATYSKKFKSLFSMENTYLYALNSEKNQEYNEIDFCDEIPKLAQNVMPVAIMLALFLEYDEIYLIGCDHSWWNYTKDEIEEGKIPDHLYKDDDKLLNINKGVFREYGYEGIQQTIERQKFEYNLLKQIAVKRKMEIYNATVGGELDCFQRIDFESIFKEK